MTIRDQSKCAYDLYLFFMSIGPLVRRDMFNHNICKCEELMSLHAGPVEYMYIMKLMSTQFTSEHYTVGKRNYFTRLIPYFTTCKFCNSMAWTTVCSFG